MKKLLVVLFASAIGTSAFSQNLCPNPSFETNTGCPTTVAQVTLATPWVNPTNHTGSADYYHTCGSGLVAVPNNFAGNEIPATGNAYMGLCMWYNVAPNFREYIQIQLTQPLVANQCYNFSFKYSQSDNCQFGTDRFGAYFSVAPVVGSGNSAPLPFVPQAANPLNNFLTTSVGWGQVTISFTAVGGEQYMLLGNFYDDTQTATQLVNGSAQYGAAYMYLDDISVTTCSNILNASQNDTICLGQSATLFATGGPGSYWWADGLLPNDTIALGSPVTVSPTTTTTYIVYSGNQTDTVIITVVAPPVVTLGNDTSVCPGFSASFTAQTSPGNTYLWNTGATTQTINPTTPGQYIVTVTNQYGCTDSDTINLMNYANPVVTLGNNQTICQGGSVILNAGNPGSSYSWSTGATTQTITVTASGSYTVVVTNSNGCIGAGTVVITFVNNPVVTLGADTSLCIGGNLTINAQNGGSSYLWSTGSTSQSINVNTSGSYSVTVTNSTGCTGTDVINVTFVNPPPASLVGDTLLCNGQSLVLVAGSAPNTFLWQDGSTQPTFIVTSAGLYWVVVSSLPGCSNDDSIQINFEDCTSLLEMPNVFTPNGDNLNDHFVPIQYINIQSATMQIYNRWGNLLFETGNVPAGWDGQFKGNECADGTYFWVLKYSDMLDAEFSLKGYLTLIRHK